MSIETFSHLKEIQSLDNMIKTHLNAIEQEELRLSDITKIRERRTQEKQRLTETLESLGKESSAQEKELFVWEKRLEKANEQLPLAINEKEVSALEKERELAEGKVEEYQNSVLEKLEQMETIEDQIKDAEEFLKGSLETVQEIQEEIFKETKAEREKIENYERRINALKEMIPAAIWDVFARARQKHRFNSSLARIINNACEKCRFQVDSQTASRVELATSPEQCSQCERLLIPLES